MLTEITELRRDVGPSTHSVEADEVEGQAKATRQRRSTT